MFRDFLLRHAEEDGTLLRDSRDIARDLCRVVAFETSAARRVAVWLRELEKVGYVEGTKTSLRVVRFADAQQARSPGAKRQADYRARQRGDAAQESHETSRVTSPGDAQETSQREEKRREGDEKRQVPGGGLRSGDIRERCRAALLNEFEARHFEPHRWPEVAEAAELLHQGLGFQGKPPLGQFPKDGGVKRIIELFDAGFTIEDIKTAKPKLLGHTFLKGVRKLHAVTPGILREVLDGSGSSESVEAVVFP